MVQLYSRLKDTSILLKKIKEFLKSQVLREPPKSGINREIACIGSVQSII